MSESEIRCFITTFLAWAMMENVILARKPFAETPVPLLADEVKEITDRFMGKLSV